MRTHTHLSKRAQSETPSGLIALNWRAVNSHAYDWFTVILTSQLNYCNIVGGWGELPLNYTQNLCLIRNTLAPEVLKHQGPSRLHYCCTSCTGSQSASMCNSSLAWHRQDCQTIYFWGCLLVPPNWIRQVNARTFLLNIILQDQVYTLSVAVPALWNSPSPKSGGWIFWSLWPLEKLWIFGF